MNETFTPASAPLGDLRAGVHYSKYLGVQAMLAQNQFSGLQGKLPTGSDPEQHQATSNPGMPIVKTEGFDKGYDRMTVDMVGRYVNEPQSGSGELEKKEGLRYARDEFTVNLYTHIGDPGDMETRQRSPHDTRMECMNATVPYWSTFAENLWLCHLAGARGHKVGTEWLMPLKSSPNFNKLIGLRADGTGNPLLPPTRNRYGLPGNATGLDDLDTTDVITLEFLTRQASRARSGSDVPLQPVNRSALMGGETEVYNGNSRLLIGFLSEEQYISIKTQTGDTSFTRLVIDANTRVDFNKHPVFCDLERFFWAGVFWFKCERFIEFHAGETADQYNPDTGVLEEVEVNVRAHRGMILGAQALAVGYADISPLIKNLPTPSGEKRTQEIKGPFHWAEDIRKGGAVVDFYSRMYSGVKKLRYEWFNKATGLMEAWDNGVYVFDTYQAG